MQTGATNPAQLACALLRLPQQECQGKGLGGSGELSMKDLHEGESLKTELHQRALVMVCYG